MKNTSYLFFIAFLLPRIYGMDVTDKADERRIFEAYKLRIHGQAENASGDALLPPG